MFKRRPRGALLSVALVCTVWSCVGRQSDDEAAGQRETAALSSQDRLLLASARVALPAPGVTLATLPHADAAGAELFARYCTTCHPLATPLAHAAVDWPRVLRRMWLRMELLDSLAVPKPDAAERLVMLRYAEENALQVAANELPNRPGRDLFVATCNRCHALPDPRQHSAEDWSAVVRRMMDHMEQIAGASISPTDLSRLVGFLSEAGSGAL